MRWQILVQPPLVCLNVDAASFLSFRVAKTTVPWQGLALALQMLKKGNEDLLQIFMSGAPEPGSVQQVASCLCQREGNGASGKLRGAATTSAGALAC